LKEIVGTVAGDDTLFVAVRDEAALRSLRARLRALAAREGRGAGDR
jgi:arginine repressor